ncbi:hypothetical protein AcW2_007438 [Taiwanofungus camphoratus]|nr:hypothetical protein AcW2_007438 [Antrodia cinnamomea]
MSELTLSELLSSASPQPEDVNVPEEAPLTPIPTSPSSTTRTVAIIKTHALDHRFDIEQRISEAGFEIVKERQMEFDTETDPDTLYELFGDDFESFAEGPVWVYVLERRRAIEVWHTLMGDADPQVARRDTPHSLRAQFGLSREQNAVMGSLDVQTAEVQIMSIFASSPPFPTTELPEVSLTGGSLRSVSSSVLSALRKTTSDPASSVTSGSKATSNGRSPFKARPVPATIAAPDIVPRMSRAAALRAGLPVEKTERIPPTKERLAKTFENVPGHKRSETITVASTAPPVVAPRMTRAASLRLGQKPLEKPKRPSTANAATKNENKATFDGVPGHKRRESIAVPSTRPPSVTPRSNRSASLRQQKEVAPPSSFMFRKPSQQAPSRSSSRTSFTQPSMSRTTVPRPASAASVQITTSRPAASRVVSTASTRSSRPSTSAGVTTTTTTSTQSRPKTNGAEAVTPAKPKPRPSGVQAPSITPRTNKSALLRAAKMGNAAAPSAMPGKPKAVPVSRAVRV